MSSNHIFVAFLNLCCSAEANHAVKPLTHQLKGLSPDRCSAWLGPASLILDKMLYLMA
jgi:hypothetical protein